MDKYEKRNLIIKKTFAPGAGYARAGANTRARGARPLMGISPGPKGPGMKGNKFNWGRALPAPRRNLFPLGKIIFVTGAGYARAGPDTRGGALRPPGL